MSNYRPYTQRQRAAILELLRISDEKYSQLVFSSGCEYALKLAMGHQSLASEKTYTKSYWAWYQNQFAIIDHNFLSRWQKHKGADDGDCLGVMRAYWMAAHHPSSFNTYPPREVNIAIEKEVEGAVC